MRKNKWARRATFVVWGAITWTGCATPTRMERQALLNAPLTTPPASEGRYGIAQPPRTTQLAFKSEPDEELAIGDGLVDPGQVAPRENSRQNVAPPTAQGTTKASPAQRSSVAAGIPATTTQTIANAIASRPAATTARAKAPSNAIQRVNVELPVEGSESIVAPESVSYSHAMSIEELLGFAQQNHPQLLVRDSEVEVARAGMVGASVRDNPQFVMDTDTPLNEPGPTQLGFRVTLPFHTGGKIAQRQAAAMATVYATSFVRHVDESLIMLEAVDAASEVLYLRSLLEVQKELEQLAEERANLFQSDVEFRRSGVRVSNKISAEMDAMALKTRQFETERDLVVAQSVLARAIGSSDTNIDISDSLEIPSGELLPLETIKCLARDRSPLIAQVSAKMGETEQLHVLAHAEGIPDFDLGPRFQSELDSEGTNSLGLRFNTDIPVRDRNQGDIAETAAEMQVDQANMQLAEFNAVSDAVAAYNELVRIRESARTLQEVTAKMEARYEQFFNDEGVKKLVTDIDALEVKQQLFSQQLVDLELRYQFFRQLHRLQVLVGQTIITSAMSEENAGTPIELTAPDLPRE